jgi:hypothetical protein
LHFLCGIVELQNKPCLLVCERTSDVNATGSRYSSYEDAFAGYFTVARWRPCSLDGTHKHVQHSSRYGRSTVALAGLIYCRIG